VFAEFVQSLPAWRPNSRSSSADTAFQFSEAECEMLKRMGFEPEKVAANMSADDAVRFIRARQAKRELTAAEREWLRSKGFPVGG